MLNTERSAKVREEILKGDEPFVTLKVWMVLMENVEHNTGRVALTRAEIAKAARTNPKAVSMATSRLERIGAIQRRPDGRGVTYWIDPRIGWFGDFSERQLAMASYLEQAEELIRKARTEPELRVVN